MKFNYDLKSKVILTDCDGVLVDWCYGFHSWMKRVHSLEPMAEEAYEMEVVYGLAKDTMKEYVRSYNASADIAYLKPLNDAVKYVKETSRRMRVCIPLHYFFILRSCCSKGTHL